VTGEHVAKNRAYWDADAADYQRRHGEDLRVRAEAWGIFRIPESEVGALPEVSGLRVLELGCGAAQWSVALAGRDARPVGLDVSEAQLAHARRAAASAGVSLRLVLADAERLPFGDSSFDLVLGDHGAMDFADPQRWVREVARTLRPEGRLVFSMHSPLHFLCWNPRTQLVEPRLHTGVEAMRTEPGEATVQFQLPYGEWIRLFRSAGFEIEDLIELRPPADATTTYEDYVPLGWARRWPAEQVWRCRRV